MWILKGIGTFRVTCPTCLGMSCTRRRGCWAMSRRLWIIEYAWAHNILDVFKDMEASIWPDEDWESLRLDESWRVRVVSAQVFSIVRNRQISQYERVLAFLENTHALLPTLVPAIKHMKITFGLKTMVIMWMLKEGAGLINIVQKINKYFPRNLPQYQVHCRKHEMFLMRQNQLNFRTFAQSLIMDKQKLEEYMQNHVEEEYGEHYAGKTEERLLDYLQELDKTLPKETYIDKIMRKNSPVKEEEKVLLDLITDDSKTISTTLRTLLHCGHTALEKCTETVRHVESPAAHTFMNGVDEVRQEQSVAAHTDRSKETACVGAEKADTMATDGGCQKSCTHVIKVPPHFCSRHQRWVRNILCECPGESSEEQQPQDSETSPLLFISTSSSDLTPTNLTIAPDYHQSPSVSDQLQKAEDPECADKPVSDPGNLAPPSNPVPAAVQTFISVGTVTVTVVPCKAVTTVTFCPLKTSATTTNDLPEMNNQDSTSPTLSIATKNPTHQTATSATPFVSKLSRRFRQGQKYFQSQGGSSKNVEFSSQTGFKITNAASSSAHATAGMDISTNTHTCSQLQAQLHVSPADHMAGSPRSSTFSSSCMQPCVVLKRMSTEACLEATKRRLQPRQCEDTEGHSDPVVSSFDVNSLYSSSSSEEDSDTEYRPNKNTLRRWFRLLEYNVE